VRIRDDETLQLRQARRPDARDGVEVRERVERTVCLAVVEDLLRRGGTDAGQRVELLERRRVQIERRGRRRGTSRRRRSAPLRHDHLLAVGKRRSEIDQLDVCPSGRAAGDRDRVGDARSLLEPVETGVSHGPGDVDDELRLDGAHGLRHA
jgi:hypothetical protein